MTNTANNNIKDRGKAVQLKTAIIYILLIVFIGIFLYFTLLQPAFDRHNELIDKRINELK